MHGRCFLPNLHSFPWLLLLLLSGCGQITFADSDEPVEPPVEAGADFNPDNCGDLEGQVVWDGGLPPRQTIQAWLQPDGGAQVTVQNPLVPIVDPKTLGVRDAVIFLRGVDPRKAKPWQHPTVLVEQRDYQIRIIQGKQPTQVGFVRRGDDIALVSRQPVFHSLHLEGATWCTLALPDPEVVVNRNMNRCGQVELSSAAGYYWARAFLFVDDHPYFTRTDAQGNFRLERVPEGEYEVVCWLPAWTYLSHERDPETALITRVKLDAPIELVQNKTAVKCNMCARAQFSIHHEGSKR